MISRLTQLISLITIAWITMTFSHELGHLIGGWLSGATLVSADLRPWSLPYSIHQPDPHPLVTLWSGPLLGVAIPIAIAVVIRRPAIWFVADFCVLANGIYLLLAWFGGDRLLDTPRLLAAGASAWLIALYCLITIAAGYMRFRRDCVNLLSPSPKTAKNSEPDGI